jgi:hypothetical protein
VVFLVVTQPFQGFLSHEDLTHLPSDELQALVDEQEQHAPGPAKDLCMRVLREEQARRAREGLE